jgi:nicotinamidase/pyrazinamidase
LTLARSVGRGREGGLVGVELWAELRREHFVCQVSVKELARRTGLSRNTVRAALRSTEPPGYRRERAGSKLDLFKEEIHRLLSDDGGLTGQRIRELIAPPRLQSVSDQFVDARVRMFGTCRSGVQEERGTVMADALVIVDVQNDFTSGGALEVPDGDEVIEPLNRLARAHPVVVATRDWHPPHHHSFEPEGGPWPVHCVRETEGAQLHPGLDQSEIDSVIDKGERRGLEGYTAFEETDLERQLRERGIGSITIGGLAANICVRSTALDARERGFDVTLATDATRGVDIEDGDTERALAELKEAGVKLKTSTELAAD